MNKAYNRINWENYPSDSTPLNEDNLNKMDVAINEIDNRVISLDTTKLPVATAYTMVKDVEFDEKTGVFTITKLNGSVIKIDTALEKISTNFRFDYSTQKLILTLIDGTTQEVDLSALLTQYEFTDSDTIAFTIDTSGKVVASVKKGSITQDMLEPNYLANIKVEVAKAESASLSADTSAKNAKTSETNAKTSEENARAYAEAAGGVDTLISGFATGTNPTIQDSTNAPLIYGKFKGYTLQDGEPTPDNPIEINGLAKGGAIEVKTTGKNLSSAGSLTRTSSVPIPIENLVNGKTYTLSGVIESTDTDYSVSGVYYNMSLQSHQARNKRFTITFTKVDTANRFVIYASIDNSTSTGDTVTVSDIQIEEGTTATPYEPYTETTTAITTGAPLYEGDYIEIYADGSGKEYRKMKEIVLDGSGDIDVRVDGGADGNKYVYISHTNSNLPKGVGDSTNIYSSHYKNNGSTDAIKDNIYTNINGLIIIREQRFSTASEFNTWLQSNPVTVVYELETPTETPLTAEQVAQFKQLYTFEPVTNVFCDGEVEVLYYKNTDNGETVGIVHKKVEASEKAINSVNNYYSSFKQTFDTVVGGTVSNNTSNVEYTEPSFSSGSIIQKITKGGSLVNGLKSATAKIAETLSSMCDFFIGKIAYNIGGKEIIDDFDYENWIAEKSEAAEGAVEYPSNTLERFERLIAQCVEASIKLNDSLSFSITCIMGYSASTVEGSVTLSYPDGFPFERTNVLNYTVKYDDNVYLTQTSNSLDIQLRSNGIVVYSKKSEACGKTFSLHLIKPKG